MLPRGITRGRQARDELRNNSLTFCLTTHYASRHITNIPSHHLAIQQNKNTCNTESAHLLHMFILTFFIWSAFLVCFKCFTLHYVWAANFV